MSLEPINPDDPQLTAYALGEMTPSEAADFEARLEVSPLAKSELSAMSDLSSMLTIGLKHEWESHVNDEAKVDFEEPKYTAFALDELSNMEKAEVEAELAASRAARKEMDSMKDVMSMLSTGLKSEWESQISSPQLEAVATPVAEESNIVAVNFGDSRRAWMGVAAAAVALLGAAFTYYFSQPVVDPIEVADWGSGPVETGAEVSVDLASESVTGVASAPGLHVPQLFLAEEVEDISELNLVSNGPALLDASYLDNEGMEPTTQPTGEMQIIPAGFSPTFQRIDSYLPQQEASAVIEAGAELLPGRHSRGLTVESFAPRVREETVVDRQIRLAAELQGVQIELEQVLTRLPQGSTERRHLELILERNSRAIGELKDQFSE